MKKKQIAITYHFCRFFFIQNKQKQKWKERKQLSDELNYF